MIKNSSLEKEVKMVSGVIDFIIAKLRDDKKVVLDTTWEELENSIEVYISDAYSELALELYNTELSNSEIFDKIKEDLLILAKIITKNSL
jgi:hypothetical protein